MFGSALNPGSTGDRITTALTVQARVVPSLAVTVKVFGAVRSTVPVGEMRDVETSVKAGASRRRSVPGATGSVTVEEAASTIAGTFRLASWTPRIARGSASASVTSAADRARL